MKKVALLFALLAALSLSSFAQNQKQTSEGRKCVFMDKLNLSDQQKQEVKALREEYKGQKEIPDAQFEEGMKKILTDQQFATFEIMQKTRHEIVKDKE